MGRRPDKRRDVAALLQWQLDMGVDVALDEEPRDRLAPEEPPPGRRAERSRDRATPRTAEGVPAPRKTAIADPAAAPEEVARQARLLARSAGTLEELRQLLADFEGCALKATAKSLVFADGLPGSRLMLVGEAPGAEEDRAGIPFVGRSGQLLDKMLAAIGLDRTQVYIANIIPWRPPGNRTPTPQESALCLPFIARQIELADPEILVCLGAPSAQALMGIKEGIMRSRGRWAEYDTGTRRIRAIATLHPAFLLRQPLQKRFAWRDFKAIRQALADNQALSQDRERP